MVDMNIIHQMIATSCHGCIQDNAFTNDQRLELIRILDKFQAVKISNIYKFTKYLKQFENKYAEFGGNVEMLEARIRNIRDAQYDAVIRVVPGLKIEKRQ